MIYKCRHFDIDELIPPEIIRDNILEDRWKFWMLFDLNALLVLDGLRDRYGPTYVNDWDMGGNLKDRGYRTFACTVGSQFSQHKRGAAFDCTFKKVSANEAREDMKKAHSLGGMYNFNLIKRIEKSVDWFHFDTGNYYVPGIKFF